MNMYIYAFGSVCRGEIYYNSDIDLLAIADGYERRFNPEVFSIYSLERIKALWDEGNPFAWHLSLEARLLFSSTSTDILSKLGRPKCYQKCEEDCIKFSNLFDEAHKSLLAQTTSAVFDLSMVFLSIRNIATCFSLGMTEHPTFSRRSALELGCESAPLSEQAYNVLERSRVLCTRGYGACLKESDVVTAMSEMPMLKKWINKLINRIKEYERFQ